MDKFESEVMSCIDSAIEAIGTPREQVVLKESAKLLNKLKLKYYYSSDDNLIKIKLLRNLAIILERLNSNDEAITHILDLYDLVTNNEEIKNDFPVEYCRAMNAYTDTFKDKLERELVIKIETENMNIYEKLGLKPDFITAKVNIYFLMEDYENVVNLLLEIHTEEKKDFVDLINEIETELYKVSSDHYKKYLNIIQANSLVS